MTTLAIKHLSQPISYCWPLAMGRLEGNFLYRYEMHVMFIAFILYLFNVLHSPHVF